MDPQKAQWQPTDNGLAITLTFTCHRDGSISIATPEGETTQFNSAQRASQGLVPLLETGLSQSKS